TEGDVVDCIMDQQFFFASRRRHTRFSRDWSSDVCSSDLADGIAELSTTLNQTGAVRQSGGYGGKPLRLPGEGANHRDNTTGGRKIGRASWRERWWSRGGAASYIG